MRLNPMPPAFQYGFLGTSHMLMHQYQKAIAILEKGVLVQPDNAPCLLYLAAAYSLAGRQEDAHKTAAKLLILNPKFSVEAFVKIYKDPAAREQLVSALRKAGLK
jgi:tetratricopeptide (TPR) repeat protein